MVIPILFPVAFAVAKIQGATVYLFRAVCKSACTFLNEIYLPRTCPTDSSRDWTRSYIPLAGDKLYDFNQDSGPQGAEDNGHTICLENRCARIVALVIPRTGIELENRLIWDVVGRRRCIRSRTSLGTDEIPMYMTLPMNTSTIEKYILFFYSRIHVDVDKRTTLIRDNIPGGDRIFNTAIIYDIPLKAS